MATQKKDSRAGQVVRVAAATGIGGLAGRTAAWHPVHGGRMNRATLIGAGVGAAIGASGEALSRKVEGGDKDSAKALGVSATGAGLLGSLQIAGHKSQQYESDELLAGLRTRMGKVTEADAVRRNTIHRRITGMEGETFIPRMPKFAREAAKKAGLKGVVTEDHTGGTMEDKLSRLHKAAKGTPEGDAALRKLNELRRRQGNTFIGKAKKAATGIMSKFTPRKTRATVGLLTRLSAREQLNAIISLKAIDLGQTYEDYPGCVAGTKSNPKKKHFPSLYISDREDDIDLPLEGTAMVRYKLRSKTTRQDDAGKKRHSADIEIQSIDPNEEEGEGEDEPVEGQPAKLLSARNQIDIIRFSGGEAVGDGIRNALRKIARRNRSGGAGLVIKRRAYEPRLAGKKTGKPTKGWLSGHSMVTETHLSARDELNAIITFDPRPRDNLGMFSGEQGGPDPNAIGIVYKQGGQSTGQNLASGAVAGIGAVTAGGALKALVKKLRKK